MGKSKRVVNEILFSERMRSSQRENFHIRNTHYLELILSQDA